MKIKLFILFLFLIHAVSLSADRYAGKFVSLTYNLPGNYVNPAQMMDLENFRTVFEYESFKDIDSYYRFTLGLYKRFDILGLGFSIESAGTDLEFREIYINSYNNSIYKFYASVFPLKNLSLGAVFNVPTITTFNYSFKSIDVSLGGIYSLRFLNIGLLLNNLYRNGKYNGNETGITAGASCLFPLRPVYVRVFTDVFYEDGLSFGLGAEGNWPLSEKVLLSLSFGYENYPGFGLGLKIYSVQFNYGMELMKDLGIKNTLSINMNF